MLMRYLDRIQVFSQWAFLLGIPSYKRYLIPGLPWVRPVRLHPPWINSLDKQGLSLSSGCSGGKTSSYRATSKSPTEALPYSWHSLRAKPDSLSSAQAAAPTNCWKFLTVSECTGLWGLYSLSPSFLPFLTWRNRLHFTFPEWHVKVGTPAARQNAHPYFLIYLKVLKRRMRCCLAADWLVVMKSWWVNRWDRQERYRASHLAGRKLDSQVKLDEPVQQKA